MTETSIYYEYFQVEKENKIKYGKNTILLYQVGAFFEIYGLKHTEQFIPEYDTIEQACHMGDLAFTMKQKVSFTLDGVVCQIYMAGFRDTQLDKYLDKFTKQGYTIVVYVQEDELGQGQGQGRRRNRIFQGVFTPSTYISSDATPTSTETNNIMCIWIESSAKNIVVGISTINIITGKTCMMEFMAKTNTEMLTYIETAIYMYQPCEILFLSEQEQKQKEFISPTIRTHWIAILTDKKARNCEKQTYIIAIIEKQFGHDAFYTCSIHFDQNIVATQSFCYLLDFLQEHNPDFIRKIQCPVFVNHTNHVFLANHTLKQLNIIQTDPTDQKSSVVSLLNQCSTIIGKRRFRHQLLHPSWDETWLQKEYTMVRTCMQEPVMIESLRFLLSSHIRDIERWVRQIVSKTLAPASIFGIYKALDQILQIDICLEEHPTITEYMGFTDEMRTHIKQMCSFLSARIDLSICSKFRTTNTWIIETNDPATDIPIMNILLLDTHIQKKNMPTTSINKTSINKPTTSINKTQAYHSLVAEYREAHATFIHIYDSISREFPETTNKPIKIHITEKSGISLQCTKTRAKWHKLNVPHSKYSFRSTSTSMDEVVFPKLDELCQKISGMRDDLSGITKGAYHEFLTDWEEHLFVLEYAVEYIGKLDVLLCRAHIALKNNYCCPTILSSNGSYVKVKQLRHVLIEPLLIHELYVPNDIDLSDNIAKKTDEKGGPGILLFGTNSSGKSSFMKSLGIAIILAQAGMFVPCSEFVFSPYKSIFSRIVSSDDLHKGLSTFVYEMVELNVILKMADKYSLVLGDELCSGTETDSAVSIFMSALETLVQSNASFLFATHFHEICKYDELKAFIESGKIRLKHLEVYYNPEHDALVYDRILKDGSGQTLYGLEVCRSLHMPDSFLNRAYQLRTKYNPSVAGILERKPSAYTSSILQGGLCEVCGKELGEEMHHLVHQQDADIRGFLPNGQHKNRPGNLSSVCRTCHDKIHVSSKNTTTIISRKKTTKGYRILGL